MAKIEDPREQEKAEILPEQQRQEQQGEELERRAAQQEQEETPARNDELDPRPRATVIGHMDHKLALRLGWQKGITTMSESRFRFLKEDLGFDVTDDPKKYLV